MSALMWVSSQFNILSNPRAGGGFLARYYGASYQGNLPFGAYTSEARKALGETWGTVPVILPVRDPLERFVSAIRHAFRTTYPKAALPSDDALTEETLAQLAEGKLDDRRDLKPQRLWLTGKVQFILPVYHFAQFAMLFPSQARRPFIVGNTYPARTISLTPANREAIRQLYAEDYRRFDKIPVWPSVPGKVFLLRGRCAACDNKSKKLTNDAIL